MLTLKHSSQQPEIMGSTDCKNECLNRIRDDKERGFKAYVRAFTTTFPFTPNTKRNTRFMIKENSSFFLTFPGQERGYPLLFSFFSFFIGARHGNHYSNVSMVCHTHHPCVELCPDGGIGCPNLERISVQGSKQFRNTKHLLSRYKFKFQEDSKVGASPQKERTSHSGGPQI